MAKRYQKLIVGEKIYKMYKNLGIPTVLRIFKKSSRPTTTSEDIVALDILLPLEDMDVSAVTNFEVGFKSIRNLLNQ